MKQSRLANVRLKFHNPIQTRQLDVAGYRVPLAGNSAASLDFAMEKLKTEDNPWTAFFNPEVETNHEGMLLLEPYQPRKIPLVLVHGLISNPATWGTLINELQQDPELMRKYQIWLFFYKTSKPILVSAAKLRESLRQTLAFLDPHGQDPALQNLVLAGHSMGGLLSRLQVTWSGRHLWNQMAKVPFEHIRVDPQFRQELAASFFFNPEPRIKRVVFMATPHQGSSQSYRMIGCVGRLLAGQLPEMQQGYADMIRQNPGAFRRGISRQLPNSIQGLSSKNPMLQGIAKLPFSPNVHLHSVIGTGGCEPCLSGDAFVPVKSARLPNAETELLVDALHTAVHTHPNAIRELKCLLETHWMEYQSVKKAGATPAPIAPVPVPLPVE